MKTKLFYVRDRVDHFPVMVTKLEGATTVESKIMREAGFARSPYKFQITDFISKQTNMDPFSWTNGRTIRVLHEHLNNYPDLFDRKKSGDLFDIPLILGERTGK